MVRAAYRHTKHMLAFQGYQHAASHSAAGPLSLADCEALYLKLLPEWNADSEEQHGTVVSKMLRHTCSMPTTECEEDNRQLLYAPYLDDILLEQAHRDSQQATVFNRVLGDPRASELWLMLLFCSTV